MTLVEMLDESSECDQCGRELAVGDLIAVGHVPIPFSGEGGIDWVPVISNCSRCAAIPSGFQPGWNVYDVTEEDLLEFAEENLREAAATSGANHEIASAMYTIARIRDYLQHRNGELSDDAPLPPVTAGQLAPAPRQIVRPTEAQRSAIEMR